MSRSPERSNSSWHGSYWQSPYHKANARLDAQLELLNKKQIVLEMEKDLLRENWILRREYGNMHGFDTPPQSRERRSSSWHRYDESGTSSGRMARDGRSRSKERGRILYSRERSCRNRKSRERDYTRRSRSRDRESNHETKSRLDLYRRRSKSSERPKPLMPKSPKRLTSPIGRDIVSYDDDYKVKLVSTKTFMPQVPDPVITKLEDIEEQEEHMNDLTPSENVHPSKSSNEDFPQIKQEPLIIDLDSEISSPNIEAEKLEVEEMPITIDIDSAEKPVPRRHQFVVLIKQLVMEMNKVGVRRLLDQNELQIKKFHPVSTKTFMPQVPDPVITKLEDIEEQEEHMNDLTPSENVHPSKSSNEDFPQNEQEPLIIDLDSEISSPNIEAEKLEVEEMPILIDIDSAEKPVPRHHQFVVLIKQLVMEMNKVGVRRLLDQNELQIKKFHFVLRHILRDLLKGQGNILRPEIISRFREEYPVDKDEEFLKNFIKDIKDGMYPGCMDYIEVKTDDDCSDDVVLVEKPYDVVTVGDSDDEEDTKPITDVIDLEEES